VGLIVQPLPLGAIALIGLSVAALTGTMRPGQALGGYAEPLVWLVLAAFGIARGMIKTGLGRRIGFLFICAMGRTSLGLGYAVVATDAVLGMVVPSNGARAGGIVFPIVKSLAEAYHSEPGPSAARLGTFLMLMVYHCDIIVAALFLTGNASNPLIASLAREVGGVDISYSRWALGAVVPALASLLVVPLFLYWRRPPEVRRTPDAAEFGRRALSALGPMNRGERVMLGVFALVTLLWLTTSWHGIDYAVTAIVGLSALLIGGVLTWDDVLSERAGWDVFIWYGAIFQMARALGEGGVTKAFAALSTQATSGVPWPVTFVVLVFGYVYAHYGFATSTARVSALFAPLLLVLIAAGTPRALAVFSLSYVSILGASLTHYGTTSSPIYYGAGYTSPTTWWLEGFFITTMNTMIWLTVGAVWWKVLGWW